MRVLGISGSLRKGSHNRRLLRAVGEQLPPHAAFTIFSGLHAIPPYSEDHDKDDAVHPAVDRLRRAIARADAVIIATPEYNASVPGVLKNAIDWASRPWPANALRGKPVLVVGASTGIFGAVWAQNDLRRILRATGAEVVEHELGPVRADELAELSEQLAEAATALSAAA
jgi:chromate reductase, NAD(P)H dehydrogenase (quinone)